MSTNTLNRLPTTSFDHQIKIVPTEPLWGKDINKKQITNVIEIHNQLKCSLYFFSCESLLDDLPDDKKASAKVARFVIRKAQTKKERHLALKRNQASGTKA